MSLALGATFYNTSAPSAGGGSAIALQAQLDRCNKQLSDWVNCASGKTPEGKQIIAALQEKIGNIKQELLQQTRQPNRVGTPSAAPVTPPASLALASIGSIGTLLNTVA